MLVYLKNSMGYTSIGGIRVYGKKYAYGSLGPADIPAKLFKENKSILEEAYYTKEWLSKRFGANFPDVNFRLSDLAKLDLDIIIDIAKCVGIDYIKSKNTSPAEKRAIIKTIRRKIS